MSRMIGSWLSIAFALGAITACSTELKRVQISGIYGSETLGEAACYKFTELGTAYSSRTLSLLGTTQKKFQYEVRHTDEIWVSDTIDDKPNTFFGKIAADRSITWRGIESATLTTDAGKKFCHRFD